MKRIPGALMAGILIAGCAPPRPAVAPVPALWSAQPHPEARPLVVLLPGIRDQAADFIRHGFTRRLEQLNPPVDWVAVDLHVGYTLQGTAVARLHADIIEPAAVRGYRHIWLAGVSLGGFNALRAMAEHERELAGVVLVAPFLGHPRVLERIEAAGGPARWTPPAGSRETATVELWVWLKNGSPETRSRIYLAYGRSDRFRLHQAMLAGLLPRAHVLTAEGGHDWRVWSRLWDRLLAPGGPWLPALARDGRGE